MVEKSGNVEGKRLMERGEMKTRNREMRQKSNVNSNYSDGISETYA
jgi:hypothetical protein